MTQLTNQQIRKLKSQAQRLDATVTVGKAGLSEAFIKGMDDALASRELVKVKFAEFKEEKQQLGPQLAEKTASHLVWIVGHVAVFYRQNPDPAKQSVQI